MSFPPRPVTPNPPPRAPPARRMHTMVAMTGPGVYVVEIFTSPEVADQASGAFLASKTSLVDLEGKWYNDAPVYGVLASRRTDLPDFEKYQVFSDKEAARRHFLRCVFNRFSFMDRDIPERMRFYWQVLRSCEIEVEVRVPHSQTLSLPSIQYLSPTLLPFIRKVTFHVNRVLDRHIYQDRPSVFQQMLRFNRDPEDLALSIDAEDHSVYERTSNIVTLGDNEFFYQIRYGLHLLQTVPDVREIFALIKPARRAIWRDDPDNKEDKDLIYHAEVHLTAIFPFLQPVLIDNDPDHVLEPRRVRVDTFGLPFTGNTHYVPQVPLNLRTLALRMLNGPKIRTLPFEDEVPPDFRPLARKVVKAVIQKFESFGGDLTRYPPSDELNELQRKGYTMSQISHFLENHPFCQFCGAFRLVPVNHPWREGAWHYYLLACLSRDDPKWINAENYYQELHRAGVTAQDIASALDKADYYSNEFKPSHPDKF